MSYNQFVEDLNDFYREAKNKGVHYEYAQTIVRDSWLENGRFDALTDFILENWDSGNCDDFIKPLEERLINENCAVNYKRLWKGIISYRLRKYIDALNRYRQHTSQIEISQINNIDTSNFDVHSVESYKDYKAVLAYQRRFLLEGLNKYKEGL